MVKKTSHLPSNYGAVGGGTCPEPNTFGEKVCSAITHYCPHIKAIEKVGNTIIASDSCGDIVFECALNANDTAASLTYNAATCVMTYVDENGNTQTYDLGSVLNKAQDDLRFDPLSCVMDWVSVNGETKQFDLSVIMDKLRDAIAWNAATCELTATMTNGQVKVFDLSSILDKLQDGVKYNDETCVLTFTGGNGSVSTIDLSGVLDKSKDSVVWNPEKCELKVTSVAGDCTLIDLTDILAKLKDKLEWDGVNCQLKYTNANGSDVNIFNLSEILNKVKTDLEFDPATCVLKWTNQDCTCDYFDIGAAVLQKMVADSLTVNVPAGTFTHIANDGTVVTVDVCALAERCKPSMTAIEHADGSKTICFNDGYGNQTCCDVNPVVIDNDSITVNGSSITFQSDNDQTIVFDVCDIVAANCNATFTGLNSDGSWSFIDNSGAVFTYTPPEETVTVIIDNGDSFNYINEAGAVVTVDKCCTNITEDADNYYVTDHNGNVAEVCKRPVKSIASDGSITVTDDGNGNYTIVTAADVVTTLTANGDGSFTHVNELGVTTTLNVCDMVRVFCPNTVEDNGDGTATIVLHGGQGGTKTDTVCGVQSNVVDNGDGTGTMVQNDGTTCDFLKEVDDQVVTTLTVNGGTFTHVNEDGVATTVDVCGMVEAVCPNIVSDNGNGTATIVLHGGTGGIKDDVVCGSRSTVVDNGDTGVVFMNDGTSCRFVKELPDPVPDIVTTFGEAGDGAWQYTNEAGVTSTFNICDAVQDFCPNTVVDNGDGTATVSLHGGAGGTKTDAVCGVQSNVVDNGDGTGTMVQNDGTTCDFVKEVDPVPVYSKKDGADLVDGDTVVTAEDNPFNEYVCADGAANFYRCDGTGVQLVPQIWDFTGATSGTPLVISAPITVANSPEIEAATLACSTIDIPACGPHRIQWIMTYGMQSTKDYVANGATFMIPKYSVNGGATWSNFNSGGVDGYACNVPVPELNDGGTSRSKEDDFTNYIITTPLASGSHELCTKVCFGSGTVSQGSIQFNKNSYRAWVDGMKCCNVTL